MSRPKRSGRLLLADLLLRAVMAAFQPSRRTSTLRKQSETILNHLPVIFCDRKERPCRVMLINSASGIIHHIVQGHSTPTTWKPNRSPGQMDCIDVFSERDEHPCGLVLAEEVMLQNSPFCHRQQQCTQPCHRFKTAHGSRICCWCSVHPAPHGCMRSKLICHAAQHLCMALHNRPHGSEATRTEPGMSYGVGVT